MHLLWKIHADFLYILFLGCNWRNGSAWNSCFKRRIWALFWLTSMFSYPVKFLEQILKLLCFLIVILALKNIFKNCCQPQLPDIKWHNNIQHRSIAGKWSICICLVFKAWEIFQIMCAVSKRCLENVKNLCRFTSSLLELIFLIGLIQLQWAKAGVDIQFVISLSESFLCISQSLI